MLSSFLLRKLLSLSEVIKISLHQAGERISSIFESEKIQVVSALAWLKVSVSAARCCKRVTGSYSSCFSWSHSLNVFYQGLAVRLLHQLFGNTVDTAG
jgi:hypothetical protein